MTIKELYTKSKGKVVRYHVPEGYIYFKVVNKPCDIFNFRVLVKLKDKVLTLMAEDNVQVESIIDDIRCLKKDTEALGLLFGEIIHDK